MQYSRRELSLMLMKCRGGLTNTFAINEGASRAKRVCHWGVQSGTFQEVDIIMWFDVITSTLARYTDMKKKTTLTGMRENGQ